MTIKFSYPFSKLSDKGFLIEYAYLLQVIETDFSELAEDFKNYDTDFGKYIFPKKGPCLLLIFVGKGCGNLFTTVRRSIPRKVEYYKMNVGHLFKVEIVNPPITAIP